MIDRSNERFNFKFLHTPNFTRGSGRQNDRSIEQTFSPAAAAVNMSAFGSFKRSSGASGGSSDKKPTVAADNADDNHVCNGDKRPRAKQPAGCSKKQKQPVDSDDSDGELWMPKDDDSDADAGLSPLLAGGMSMNKKKIAKREPASLETEDHDYIREQCIVPTECLKTFAEVLGGRAARIFAEQYRPVSSGAARALSGLLLFGPSGTGKSLIAQAITTHIGGTFYKLSAAHLPNGKAGAQRIDALFDVALAGKLPAVIFIDECDTILSSRAASRVGHFAGRFERFTDNLLVIGATNEPEHIAPKILTGRFERKIFIDNPSAQARKAMILRQLAEEIADHELSSMDLEFVVEKTAGRSAVNMERLVSSAALHAAFAPVTRDDFLTALEEEPSDFDRVIAAGNAKFDRAHGWHPM